ncbi:MAG: FecR family protein [Butyricimonas paravirosa]
MRNSGDTLNYGSCRWATVPARYIATACSGGEYTVLADGTTVYLNAESELRFPKQFRGKNRKVYLTGEGYFDVQRNEKQPFIVEAQQVEVRVLGTSFGVRAYTKEENVLTTLIQGRVNVEADGQQVELNPGQQADFNRGNDRLTVAR